MNNANTPKRQIHWDFIRLALASVADLCIIPLQDYLGLEVRQESIHRLRSGITGGGE